MTGHGGTIKYPQKNSRFPIPNAETPHAPRLGALDASCCRCSRFWECSAFAVEMFVQGPNSCVPDYAVAQANKPLSLQTTWSRPCLCTVGTNACIVYFFYGPFLVTAMAPNDTMHVFGALGKGSPAACPATGMKSRETHKGSATGIPAYMLLTLCCTDSTWTQKYVK